MIVWLSVIAIVIVSIYFHFQRKPDDVFQRRFRRNRSLGIDYKKRRSAGRREEIAHVDPETHAMPARAVHVFDGLDALITAAAHEFVRCARAAVAARGRFTVALSGGSTPKPLYQRLTAEPFRSQVEWSRVEVFWGDERCVPPASTESNYRMAHEAMLAHLPIPKEQIHRMEAERTDRDAAARDYQAVLARAFGVSPDGEPPALDLLLMGMGPEGHTASLFPHTTALEEMTRWVVVNFVPKLKAERMTMTRPILNRGREVLYLVAGADKAETLAEVLNGPANPMLLPAQLIQPTGQLVWFLERAAAARLSSSLTS
jgi:6-phosphogluconolactonase